MERITNCLRVLVSRVGIVGGTLVRSSFEIRRPEVSKVFACLCVVLGLTLETRVPGSSSDQSFCKEIRLISNRRFDVAATIHLVLFPFKA